VPVTLARCKRWQAHYLRTHEIGRAPQEVARRLDDRALEGRLVEEKLSVVAPQRGVVHGARVRKPRRSGTVVIGTFGRAIGMPALRNRYAFRCLAKQALARDHISGERTGARGEPGCLTPISRCRSRR